MSKQTASRKQHALAAISQVDGINETQTQELLFEQNDVCNAEEVGKILLLHPVTVRLKAAAGEIPGRQIGNRWRFSRTRITEWLRAA